MKQRKTGAGYWLLILIFLLCLMWVMDNAFDVEEPTWSQVRQLFLQEKVEEFAISPDYLLTMKVRDAAEGAEVQYYQLHDFQLFYDELNDLVQEQTARGIITAYDYPDPAKTNWLEILLPYALILGGVVFLYQTVGLGLIIAGVALIVLTQGRAKKNIFAKFIFGLKGLYDLISYASDLLSYSRILALGLAAGVMAQVFNLLATLGGPTVPGFILLIFVMLIGHGLNLAINVLGSFVHTCRLQYLEFFSRFYEDGGSPFKPALTSDKFSTVEKDPEENTALTPKK